MEKNPLNESFARLNTSRFFLEQLKKYEKEGNDFQHSLHAFIVFGRSVHQLLLKTELVRISRKFKKIGQIEKYQSLTNWTNEKISSTLKDNVFDYFLNKRNYILKEAGLKLTREINMIDPIRITDTVTVIRYDKDGKLIDSTSSKASSNNLIESNSESISKWLFEDWEGNEDIITLCEQFQERLEKLAREANEFLKNL